MARLARYWLLLAVLCTIATAAPELPRAAVHISEPQVVGIGFGGYRCSGSIIGKDLVLTAAHCFSHGAAPSPTNPVRVWIQGKRYDFQPLYIGKPNSGKDFALLRGPTGNVIPFTLATDRLPLPTPVQILSVRSGLDNQMVLPAVTVEYTNTPDGTKMIMLADVRPGDSGSAILGPTGDVVGVVYAYANYSRNVAYAVYFPAIRAAIATLPK